MSEILLINPSWGGGVSRRGGRHNRRWPPLDLLNCAALLRGQGLEVRLIDARAVPTGLKEMRAAARGAKMVFLTSSPLDRWQCPNLELESFCALARELHHPRLVILGVHGTLLPQRLLQETGAWALVRGEPETAAPRLAAGQERSLVPGAAWLEDGQLALGPEPELLDLAALPLPAFDLAPPHLYGYEVMGGDFALIETSRGCPFACRFCLKDMYGPGMRYKELDLVLAEVASVKELGGRHLYFMDLEFTANRKRVLELCRLLAEVKHGLKWCCQTRVDTVDKEVLAALKQAGCTLVHYGVESGSERVLSYLQKKVTPSQVEQAVRLTRAAGMMSSCFFMFGFPGESQADRQATVDLARRLPAELCSFHLATPYPGTGLAADCPGLEAFAEFDSVHFEREELARWVRRGYLGFYLNPRRLATLLGRGGPALAARGGRLLAGFLR